MGRAFWGVVGVGVFPHVEMDPGGGMLGGRDGWG